MSAAAALPFWHVPAAEFLASTEDLTNEEFGALMRISLFSWVKSRPLVNDAKRIARTLRCTRGRWLKRLRPALEEFFEPFPPDGEGDENGLLQLKNLERDRASAYEKTRPKSSQKPPKNDEKSGLFSGESSPYAREESQSESESRKSHPPSSSLRPPGDGDGDAVTVTSEFLKARGESFPAAPPLRDVERLRAEAAALVEQLPVDDVVAVVRARMSALATRGQRAPNSVRFCKDTVAERAAALQRDAAPNTSPAAKLERLVDLWGRRLQMPAWRQEWGPRPGDAGCEIPAEVLALLGAGAPAAQSSATSAAAD